MFFGENRPKYMNFGAIGTVIGHEITHGFDDVGRQYDQDGKRTGSLKINALIFYFKIPGNLENWWETTALQRFLNQTKCITDQYSKFYAKQVGFFLNGKTTLGENIADNGGVKEAYRAYSNQIIYEKILEFHAIIIVF